MAFRFDPKKGKIAHQARALATGRLDHALAALNDYPQRPEALHDARTDIKKLRGLLRLLRPVFDGYAVENASLRDGARAVSGRRDDTAMVECLDRLTLRYGPGLNTEAMAALRDALLAGQVAQASGSDDQLEFLRQTLTEMRDRVPGWKLDAKGVRALTPGLSRTLSQAARAMEQARATGAPEAFHDWRKHVKYHWYHAALLRRVKPQKMAERIALAKELGNCWATTTTW